MKDPLELDPKHEVTGVWDAKSSWLSKNTKILKLLYQTVAPQAQFFEFRGQTKMDGKPLVCSTGL